MGRQVTFQRPGWRTGEQLMRRGPRMLGLMSAVEQACSKVLVAFCGPIYFGGIFYVFVWSSLHPMNIGGEQQLWGGLRTVLTRQGICLVAVVLGP